MPRNYLVLGQWNAVCDRCGLEFKSSSLKKEWTGLMVCDKCFEPRHPSTLFNPTTREGSIPWSTPEPADVFVSVLAFLSTEDLQPIMPETGPEVALQTES